MGVYVFDMEMPAEEYGTMTIKIYPNGHVAEYIGDMGRVWEAVPVPPHGRLIDADEFLERAIGTKCFRGDYALMLEELVVESATIIPADLAEGEEG